MRRFSTTFLASAGAIVALVGSSVAWSQADTSTTRTIRGRITEVRPAENELTVRSLRGDEVKLTVNDRSHLELQRQPAKLGDFREGMRVRVTYEPEQGKNRVLSMTQSRLTMENIQKEMNDTLESAKSYTYQQKAEYQKKLQGVLQDLDEHINDLKSKAAEATEEAKKRYAKEMEELGPKREALRRKLGQVRDAAPDVWDDIKSGVGAAAHDLGRAIERARSRLQDKPPSPDKEPR
jgi:hypothetical protein